MQTHSFLKSPDMYPQLAFEWLWAHAWLKKFLILVYSKEENKYKGVLTKASHVVLVLAKEVISILKQPSCIAAPQKT